MSYCYLPKIGNEFSKSSWNTISEGDFTPDDAFTQGVLAGLTEMEKSILESRAGETWMTNREGGSREGSDSNTGISVDESNNEIVIVYNEKEYRNSEEILIEEGVEEITLEARSDQKLTEVAWEGVQGDGTQATFNVAEQLEGEFVKVKVSSGALTATVQLAKKKPVKITTIDPFFAPYRKDSVTIIYQLLSGEYKYAKLQVFKNGDTQHPVYEDTSIPVTGELKVSWDGTMNKGTDRGQYVSVFNSPYTATITTSKTEDFTDSFSASDDIKGGN